MFAVYRATVVSPFQGLALVLWWLAQGVALGFLVLPLWGTGRQRRCRTARASRERPLFFN
jgi:hypothetical protein